MIGQGPGVTHRAAHDLDLPGIGRLAANTNTSTVVTSHIHRRVVQDRAVVDPDLDLAPDRAQRPREVVPDRRVVDEQLDNLWVVLRLRQACRSRLPPLWIHA